MNEFQKLARSFFLSYCHIINPNFKSNWHHVEIAKHLDQIAQGKPKRLIVSLPPRHGKSFLISQHFPTFFLGNNPKKNIILTAYNQSLAEDFGVYAKNLMQTDGYQSIFNVSISKSSKSKKRFSVSGGGGSFYAVGRGGAITGRGANLIVIDDLIKNDHEAQSETYRSAMMEWYKNTLRTRLMPNGSIIVVQTRWHKNDLIGELLEHSKENWEHLKYPAIHEDKALWPDMYSKENLETIKTEIGSLNFEGLYQQEPTIQEGNIIKRDWIQYYDEIPRVIDQSIITFDMTFKGNKDSDFVVGQKWSKVGNCFYLVDMIRGKWDFTQTLFHMKQFLNFHKECSNIVIEDAANASAIYSTIKQYVSGVRLWKPMTSKENRLRSVAPLFEAKNVYIPSQAKYDIFVMELLGFPNQSHDDTVDACSMALLNLNQQSSGMIMSLGERLF